MKEVKYYYYSGVDDYADLNSDERFILKNLDYYCRGLIRPSYVAKIFLSTKTTGYIAYIDDTPIGFIMFQDGKGQDEAKSIKAGQRSLVLKLLCTLDKKVILEDVGKTDVKIGKELLTKMEKFAKRYKYDVMVASALDTAVNFYKKYNWKVSTGDKIKKFFKIIKIDETPIKKKLKGGGKIRKHKGINQTTGKLKRGFKYSGKKLKSGLPQIIKIK